MIVVADTSPVSHLVRIAQIDILPSLFETIVIPSQVAFELAHHNAPESVREFIRRPPNWLDIILPKQIKTIPQLDPGEEAAINLAVEINADLLLYCYSVSGLGG